MSTHKSVLLYLVRHAHADWSSDEGRPLSHRGRRDAECVARILGSSPVCRIVSSPYERARQTVEPLARQKGLPVELWSCLRERELGLWCAPTFEDAVRMTWENMAFAHPGGETNHEAQARALKGAERLLGTTSGPIVLSTHGNLLALILKHYDSSIGFSFWRSLTMPDVYRLELEPRSEPQISRMEGSRWSGSSLSTTCAPGPT